MSSTPQGIFKFDEMNDKDKAYLVKLLAVIIASIFTALITGLRYEQAATGFTNGWLGLTIFFSTSIGMAYYIKDRFDLADMSNMQIFRHGIAIGFFSFLWIWIIVFQFFIF